MTRCKHYFYRLNDSLYVNMFLLSPPLMEVLETIPHRKWIPPSLNAISPLLYSEQANLTT